MTATQKRICLIILTTACTLTWISPIKAQTVGAPHPHPAMCHEIMTDAPLPPFLKGLQLSDIQSDAIFGILHTQKPQLRQKLLQLDKGREQLHSLVISPNYSETEARKLAESISRILAEIELLHSRADHDIYALLSNQQREQANQVSLRGEKVRPHMI